MNSTMQAVVIHGPKDYRLERIPVSTRRPRRGVGRRCRPSGSAPATSSATTAHPCTGATSPVPPTSTCWWFPATNSSARSSRSTISARQRWGVDTGDRVVAEQIVPCWKCRFCRRGQYWMCAAEHIFGFSRATHGAMAEYMIYPQDAFVHKVSSDLPAAHAAFAEPLSCALHAVERATISFGDVVVVAGLRSDRAWHDRRRAGEEPRARRRLGPLPDKLDIAAACGADMAIESAARTLNPWCAA